MRTLWARAGEVVTLQIVDVEVRSAVTRRLRGRRRERARRQFTERRDETLTVDVDDTLVENASVIAEGHRLRALDALHLAAALSLRDPALVVATWDADLATAARAVGLAVASG